LKPGGKSAPVEIDDGRRSMYKLFVENKIISPGDFDLCWCRPDMSVAPVGVVEPFIQVLGDKGILPVEKALKVLCDHSRSAFLPLRCYDIDLDLAKKFPIDTC